MKALLENWLGAVMVAVAVGIIIGAIASAVVDVRRGEQRGEFLSACVAKSTPEACVAAWEKIH